MLNIFKDKGLESKVQDLINYAQSQREQIERLEKEVKRLSFEVANKPKYEKRTVIKNITITDVSSTVFYKRGLPNEYTYLYSTFDSKTKEHHLFLPIDKLELLIKK